MVQCNSNSTTYRPSYQPAASYCAALLTPSKNMTNKSEFAAACSFSTAKVVFSKMPGTSMTLRGTAGIEKESTECKARLG